MSERASPTRSYYSCRATWSNCNHLGQLAIADLLTDPDLTARADAERDGLIDMLGRRVAVFNEGAAAAGLSVPRYGGGFFISVFTADAEKTAAAMRAEGVYVVPMTGAVRVALCATPEAQVPRIVEALRIGVDAGHRLVRSARGRPESMPCSSQ